jgi:GDP-L-fucose synthase
VESTTDGFKPNPEFWAKRRVTVTGGAGFLGRHVVRKLKERGCKDIFVPLIQDYNLVRVEYVRQMYEDGKPDMVIHLAGVVGGLGIIRKHPGKFFYDNLVMGLQLIEEARLRGVEKFVIMSTVCAYPKNTPIPFKEENLWDGYPEETNAPYGLAKKMLLVQSQAYREEYGLNSIYLLSANLYGPGDKFDPESSHVIPALIMKCFEAKARGDDHISVWGTGKASREFLYVEDAAEGILLAAEFYDESEPVNLGCDFETTIAELIEIIARITGFDGKIVWDSTKPDGQPRRRLDASRAKALFGFESKMDLCTGLERTVRYYTEVCLGASGKKGQAGGREQ